MPDPRGTWTEAAVIRRPLVAVARPRRSSRFAGIRNAVNCYSPTEDVLANATPNWYGGEWSIQELYKGTAALHFIPGNCEGGWGYNSDHTNILANFGDTPSKTRYS